MQTVHQNINKNFKLQQYIFGYLIFIFIISIMIKLNFLNNHNLGFYQLLIYYIVAMPFIQFNIDMINKTNKTILLTKQQLQDKKFVPFNLMIDSYLISLPEDFLVKYHFVKLIITVFSPVIIFFL